MVSSKASSLIFIAFLIFSISSGVFILLEATNSFDDLINLAKEKASLIASNSEYESDKLSIPNLVTPSTFASSTNLL